MNRIWMVTCRDFTAVVGRKGFLIGLLLTPILILTVIIVGPRIVNSSSPPVHGAVAAVDLSGKALGELHTALEPAAIAARQAEYARQLSPQNKSPRDGQSGAPVPPVPLLTLMERPAETDLRQEKSWLIESAAADNPHLALLVIKPDAVVRATGDPQFGGYDLYASPRLDAATEAALHDSVRQALVAARLKNIGLDHAAIETTMRVTRPEAVIIGASGERAAQRGLRRMLPFFCGVLLFMGVMIGGQTLMTSTIEEKSSRVIEVLLAAVSPLQLMWGKLLAHLGMSLLILAVYAGVGLATLSHFAMTGAIDPLLLVYLPLFFITAYLFYGALMLAIGAAVDQVADTQALMMPVILLLLAPYLLTGMIGQAPNSPFSVAMSFIPPVNTFAMLARLASDSPPPAWQVMLTIGVGLAAAAAVLWLAAKIFRIGLLMHGKPPNFGTLIRWARMA